MPTSGHRHRQCPSTLPSPEGLRTNLNLVLTAADLGMAAERVEAEAGVADSGTGAADSVAMAMSAIAGAVRVDVARVVDM